MGREGEGGGEPAAQGEGAEGNPAGVPPSSLGEGWEGLWRGESLSGTKKGEVLSPGCVGTERGMRRFTEAGIYTYLVSKSISIII